jgi:two-component sensor histidine kinase
VTHAYRARDAGTIELRAELLVPDTLLVVVTDDGEGMSPHPGHSGLGLGIPLIGSLTTGVEIEPHRPHGTSVRMRFALASQEE